MIVSFLYIALRRLLELAVIRLRSEHSKDLELVVVRHQLEVLRRQVKRPQLRQGDRIFLAAASRVLPRNRWRAFCVTPTTLLRWHRGLVARRWTYRRRGSGRRPLAQETEARFYPWAPLTSVPPLHCIVKSILDNSTSCCD